MPHPYGYGHKQTRRRWAPKVRSGKVNCWRCRKRIPPGSKWDLGHMPEGGRHPEHIRCNRATLSHARRTQEPPFGDLPDPDSGNDVDRWSRHWYGGGFNPRCPDCRKRGEACPAAEAA